MNPETEKVIDQLYDHLLAHSFFDTTVRKLLGIPQDADVTENEDYSEKLTGLVDETLAAMIAVNRSGEKN